MKKKKNKPVSWLLIAGIVIILGLIIFFVIRSRVENYSLSLTEKRWIESNKNKIIDISVMNNIPVFGMEGNGIYFSFLEYFEEKTGLELNKLSYSAPAKAPSADYSFKIIDENDDLTRNDMIFYEDNFVIISKENKKIVDVESLFGHKIGVMSFDISSITNYLGSNGNLSYVPFEDINLLFLQFADEELDFIVVPKNQYLDRIISSNYYISYNLSALSNKYVLSFNGNNNTLNSIFGKKYKEWYKTYFDNLYTEKMNEFYFGLSGIDEKEKSAFKSRVYIYGYVENLPYETLKSGTFYGLNSEFLKGFEAFSGTQFQFKKYSTVSELEKAISDGKVDIVFNYYSFNELKGVNYTIQTYPGNYVILSHINNNVTIDSFASLKGKEIYTLKDTALAKYMNDFSGATIKAYNKVNNLLGNKEPLILLDLNMYNYYKNSKLKDYYITYDNTASVDYNFVIKRDETNNIFTEVFQYYLTNINHTEFTNRGMFNLINAKSFIAFSYIYYLLLLIFVLIFGIIIKKKMRIIKKGKEDKTRYMDPLTSLKNRTYLTVNMNRWDDNKVYPQAIIMIDLNKLKDVNNNHGYEEGDRLIKTAANILINNQLQNTDIVRSDGNEFLIYMIGYEEGQVIAYMRRLYKLMKDLPYEHGATLGYSMITDDVKLIEDAINEAVLDMITNKELKANE